MSYEKFEDKWRFELEEVQEKVWPWEWFWLPSPPEEVTEKSVVKYLKIVKPYVARGKIYYRWKRRAEKWTLSYLQTISALEDENIRGWMSIFLPILNVLTYIVLMTVPCVFIGTIYMGGYILYLLFIFFSEHNLEEFWELLFNISPFLLVIGLALLVYIVSICYSYLILRPYNMLFSSNTQKRKKYRERLAILQQRENR